MFNPKLVFFVLLGGNGFKSALSAIGNDKFKVYAKTVY